MSYGYNSAKSGFLSNYFAFFDTKEHHVVFFNIRNKLIITRCVENNNYFRHIKAICRIAQHER